MTDQTDDVARSSHSSLPVLVASVLVVLAVAWLVLGRLSGDPPPAAAAASAAGAPPPAPTSAEAFEPVRRTVALEALPAESGKIRLVVVDPVGRPVEGAEVRRGRLAGRALIDCVTATTTDPAGCAVLPAEADRPALAIGASGYASEVVPTVSPGTLRVVLTPGSRLRVVCENLAGAPVQGLRLCAYQRAVGAHVVADDVARPPISAGVVDRSDVVWTAVTDRLGVAEFGDVSSGTLIWEVADEGHAIVRIDGDGSKVIELQPGQAMDVRAVVEPLLAAVVHVRGGDVLTHAWIAPRKIPVLLNEL